MVSSAARSHAVDLASRPLTSRPLASRPQLASLSLGGLLLLGEVHRLALEHVQQRLRRFHDLRVRRLRLATTRAHTQTRPRSASANRRFRETKMVRGVAAHLGDGFIILGARRHLAREVVVDARQPLGEDTKVVLNLGCGSERCSSKAESARAAGGGRTRVRAVHGAHPSPPRPARSTC